MKHKTNCKTVDVTPEHPDYVTGSKAQGKKTVVLLIHLVT